MKKLLAIALIIFFCLSIPALAEDTPLERPEITAFQVQTQLGPMIAKPFTLPGDHRPGLNKHQCAAPTPPPTREPGPEQAVCRMNLGTQGGTLIDPELMPQHDDLKLQGHPRPKQSSQKCQQCIDSRLHASEFRSAAG